MPEARLEGAWSSLSQQRVSLPTARGWSKTSFNPDPPVIDRAHPSAQGSELLMPRGDSSDTERDSGDSTARHSALPAPAAHLLLSQAEPGTHSCTHIVPSTF